MKKYLTPDFDVTVYEVADKITLTGSVTFDDEVETTEAPTNKTDWEDWD